MQRVERANRNGERLERAGERRRLGHRMDRYADRFRRRRQTSIIAREFNLQTLAAQEFDCRKMQGVQRPNMDRERIERPFERAFAHFNKIDTTKKRGRLIPKGIASVVRMESVPDLINQETA